MTRRRALSCIATIALLAVASCGGGDDDSQAPTPDAGIRVASFDFAESALLAEMYAQVIESRDVPVVRLGAIGPREIVAPALRIDGFRFTSTTEF